MKVLLVDAYDSFVHIIDQYLRALGAETVVVRSHSQTLTELAELAPDAIVLGPGPGHPKVSGHVEIIREFGDRVPLLGVCLGHQAIGLAFGGRVRLADNLMHGKTSEIEHDGDGVFRGLEVPATVTRYHSLVVDRPLPEDLMVTATSVDDGYVMGLRHRFRPIEGVQFHPESITTESGMTMLGNFLELAAASLAEPVR
ncbi:anthranilate synthase component II [Nocardia tengchongensis]|uniref:anthranilate synthase component II n=1 Tax=Nocardia tengchongensis TaxID=2055889 RepID=UPI00367A528D